MSTAAIIPTLNAQQQAFALWQHQWANTARPNQIPELVSPPGFVEMGYLAGRGFGKTRVGAEWLGRATYLDGAGFDSAVIAPTYQDVKFTCFEGESGLLSVIPPELIKAYNKSDLVIEMYNAAGGVSSIRGFTAEKPERLRGPQHTRIWADELAAWIYDDVWDMAMMGLRLGQHPQALWTTTPKPKELVRKLVAKKPGLSLIHI